MDMSRILVVVKFGGALIFLLWDIDFFFFLGSWEFFGHDFGHGKFFGHVILVMEIFWTHDSGHGKFFGHVILVMGNVLDIWFWS